MVDRHNEANPELPLSISVGFALKSDSTTMIKLKGGEIPLECRILSIADAYDAMTRDRPYRRAISHEEAIAEIRRCSGTQFDPQRASLFIRILGK